jgi:hypothetical protein
MSIKTVKNAEMSRDIRVALSTEPDYSAEFTNEVTALQLAIADELSAPVEHDADMNYSSAQKLVVWLDRGCRPVAARDPKSAYRLIDFVSSRGRFFAFLTLGLSTSTVGWKEKGLEEPRRSWSVVARNSLPDEIKSVQSRIASIMDANRYSLLDESVLSQEAAGQLTQLDGQPATVFDVLFSEIY